MPALTPYEQFTLGYEDYLEIPLQVWQSIKRRLYSIASRLHLTQSFYFSMLYFSLLFLISLGSCLFRFSLLHFLFSIFPSPLLFRLFVLYLSLFLPFDSFLLFSLISHSFSLRFALSRSFFALSHSFLLFSVLFDSR